MSMKWEKFDHQKLYDDGEYVIEIKGRWRVILMIESELHEGKWFNTFCDDDGDSDWNTADFTRIFRLDLDDTPSPVEQANAFLDARFDTIN